MGIAESLKYRRSQYSLTKKLPVSRETVEETIRSVTALVPDAFNCRSARVVVAFGEKHDEFWKRVDEALSGKISPEKMDGFKNGAGTILYFYDQDVTRGLQEKFPRYADRFPLWAREANGMLQISIWTALRDLGIGANLQHYNPVIDNMVREMFGVPESWLLIGQMPFGAIAGPASDKAGEDIDLRVKVFR